MNIKQLINENRIDLIVGFNYVDFYENKYNTDFFVDLFIEYKKSFNNLLEIVDNKKYQGKEDFLKRFNTLIENIKKIGSNHTKIPVLIYNNQYWLENGFHRVSILHYYNLIGNFNITNCKNIQHQWYPTNIQYFLERGYSKNYCDYIIYEFLKKYKKKFNCIILFPSNKKLPDNLYNEINSIYTLNIDVNKYNNNFKNNFIQLLYYHENWCINGKFTNKSANCFKTDGILKIFFIEHTKLNKLVDFKERVRNFYDIGKDSIHIPDTQNENDTILQLLNNNTLSFFKKTPSLYIKFTNFNILFKKLKKFLKSNNIDSKKICITGSSVLSVYSIRDCNDIDLFIDKKNIHIFKNTCFDNHNKYTINKNYSKHFEDIIYNPDNHFYYQNIKFCNLSLILYNKHYRVKHKLFGDVSIKKDLKDINYIENII
jgi:hypothetical protein